MTPDAQELLRKIEAFDIDGGPCELPFAARLAREHGWSRHYADRVVREYKRYVFLAKRSGTPVCPSEDVDAAWHLHLTYTRSYWKRFCGDVLGVPLHHDPTRGGASESAKHLKMYHDTLAAYREAFGEEPPANIWPPATQRFGTDTRQRMVNTSRNWIVPKQPAKRVAQVAAAFLAAAVVLPGCEGGLNPFELKGTDFFYFLAPAMLLAVGLGRVIRSAMQGPGPRPDDAGEDLTWEDAAYLAGGYPRLTTAAISRLAEDGVVKVVDDRLELGPNPASGRTEVEEVVIHRLPIKRTDLRALQDSIANRFSRRVIELEDAGHLLPKPRQFGVVMAALSPLLAVELFFGLPRLLMGLANGKPAGFLIAFLAIGGIAGAILIAAGPKHRTRRGTHSIAELRRRKQTSKTDAGMAVALFGTAILAGTSIAYMQSWYPRPTATGGDGGCGSGCSTNSGGDSGGSGCGGGGSGCGGCGGGGGD